MKKTKQRTPSKALYRGFIEPKTDSTHYFLGAGMVPQVVLQPNADWTDSLPETEKQSVNFETFNCTSFNTLNAIEMLMFKKFGKRVNYSDRWVGIIAGTSAKKGGNDPHVVCEAIRKHGLIPEEMLPFSSDLKNADEYYSFKGSDEKACREAGREWLRQYSFMHEWVFDKNQPLEEKLNNMKAALKCSPLALAVSAWFDKDGIYVKGGPVNHWTSKFAQPDFSKIFDSYEPFIKTVYQDFPYCKRFSIEQNVTSENVGGFLAILKLLAQAFGLYSPNTVIPENKPAMPKESLLHKWGKAIEEYENANKAWNNPGAIRSSKGPFLKFKTYDEGFAYLLNYLTRAATGQHSAYKKGGETTLLEFQNIYSPKEDSNDPEAYARFIAQRIGVTVNTKIKTLI